MAQSLDKVSREFRTAVLGGDHVLARQLAPEYTGALGQLWESLPESERVAARELLVWAQQMTVVQRAVAAAQLAVIEKASQYNVHRAVEARGPAVQFSA
jgi:hypothetical protein